MSQSLVSFNATTIPRLERRVASFEIDKAFRLLSEHALGYEAAQAALRALDVFEGHIDPDGLRDLREQLADHMDDCKSDPNYGSACADAYARYVAAEEDEGDESWCDEEGDSEESEESDSSEAADFVVDDED